MDKKDRGKDAKEMVKKDQLIELKIAVLGKSLVGKSALTYRLINDKFPTDHDTTIEDQYRINVNIDEYNCKLGIVFIANFQKYWIQQDKMITKQC